MSDEPRTYRTKTGHILTDADIEALADEAERGYDVEHLVRKKPIRSRTIARYKGWCAACGGPISPGDQLEGSNEGGWNHNDCDKALYLTTSDDGT